MATAVNTERIAPIGSSYINTPRYSARREAGATRGSIKTHSRTSLALRQSIAEQMATLTETAVIEEISRNRFEVTFLVTHRVLPIREGADA